MGIYADFNGIENFDRSKTSAVDMQDNSRVVIMDVTGYGTLQSLSRHQVRFYEGQVLQFNDPDGLMISGVMCFYPERIKSNCSGWFAKFRWNDVVDCEPLEHDYNTHLCFKCQEDIRPHLNAVGQQYNEECPFCGTSVMFPMAAPS